MGPVKPLTYSLFSVSKSFHLVFPSGDGGDGGVCRTEAGMPYSRTHSKEVVGLQTPDPSSIHTTTLL